jgi:ribose 5-phosphate isomerase A
VTAEDLKRIAAETAARRIESGQRVGLGTGSTTKYFIEALAGRLRTREIRDLVGVPTSKRTEDLARALGIPLATLDEIAALDVAVDGADEVDPGLDLIKGLGGALLREKIVAAASKRFIVIADQGKLVSRLGERSPVPVEILDFGWRSTRDRIARLGCDPVLRTADGGPPFRTDQGNTILDCRFPSIEDAAALAREIDAVPGVVGHGLFLGMADEVILGTPTGPETRTRHQRNPTRATQ